MTRAALRPGLRAAIRGTPRRAESSWWAVAGKTCAFAYQPKGAASYAASLSNLANPGTYDAVEGATPDWASETGWGVGAGKYLTINPRPTVAAAWTAVIRCTMTGTAGRALCVADGSDQYVHSVGASSATKYQMNSGNGSWQSGDIRDGNNHVWAITLGEVYQDGTDIADIAGSAITGVYVGIGALVLSWAVINGIAATVQAVAMYSATLTPAEVAALSTRMAAL